MRGLFWRNLALSLGFLLSLSASTAFAQDRGRLHCRASAADVILQVIRATPDVHVYEFRGEDAKVGIALYNSLPPHGHLQGDRFYILIKPGAPISHLMIGDSDCLRDTATVDRHTAGVIKQVIESAAAQSSI